MRCWQLALLLTVSAIAAPAAAEDPSSTGRAAVSEDEAAVGLYLTPWKDEDARPTARSPSHYTQALAPADRAADQVRSRTLDNIDSYERMRRQSLSY